MQDRTLPVFDSCKALRSFDDQSVPPRCTDRMPTMTGNGVFTKSQHMRGFN